MPPSSSSSRTRRRLSPARLRCQTTTAVALAPAISRFVRGARSGCRALVVRSGSPPRQLQAAGIAPTPPPGRPRRSATSSVRGPGGCEVAGWALVVAVSAMSNTPAPTMWRHPARRELSRTARGSGKPRRTRTPCARTAATDRRPVPLLPAGLLDNAATVASAGPHRRAPSLRPHRPAAGKRYPSRFPSLHRGYPRTGPDALGRSRKRDRPTGSRPAVSREGRSNADRLKIEATRWEHRGHALYTREPSAVTAAVRYANSIRTRFGGCPPTCALFVAISGTSTVAAGYKP